MGGRWRKTPRLAAGEVEPRGYGDAVTKYSYKL
jgi:hypothetical protein